MTFDMTRHLPLFYLPIFLSFHITQNSLVPFSSIFLCTEMARQPSRANADTASQNNVLTAQVTDVKKQNRNTAISVVAITHFIIVTTILFLFINIISQ